MKLSKVFIYNNDRPESLEAADKFRKSVEADGIVVCHDCKDADLLVCVGGDGAFLRFVQSCNFPSQPIIGINTGHLGFFQEFTADRIGRFEEIIGTDRFTIQEIRPVCATVHHNLGVDQFLGLNEVLFRGPYSHLTHFTVSIEDTVIQEFSGDGMLVSTSAGSTAYNYSLGGALAAPELDALQLTPIAPMNTNAYRCFRSSLVYPSSMKLTLTPNNRTSRDSIEVVNDGLTSSFRNVNKIEITQSDVTINIIRLETYNYWEKLNSKLL